MHIKSIVAGAALALAFTVGSASAADQFTTLKGISADVMAPQEMGVVVGAGPVAELRVIITGTGPTAQEPITSGLALSSGALTGLTESFGGGTETVGAVTFGIPL